MAIVTAWKYRELNKNKVHGSDLVKNLDRPLHASKSPPNITAIVKSESVPSRQARSILDHCIAYHQVKVWFQNRRIKWRKHHLEVTQQRLAVLQRHRPEEREDDV
ncbi:unnamed protein product [Diatraea saccharalis]|uniref:Homeobox domain-containing protein n=1 Tax=Diatraea saccharalis TaxID=40085 RepID=A0A9N9WEJ5_9NEOP|nr:unnamed protein product [Diatraea saccharalis]